MSSVSSREIAALGCRNHLDILLNHHSIIFALWIFLRRYYMLSCGDKTPSFVSHTMTLAFNVHSLPHMIEIGIWTRIYHLNFLFYRLLLMILILLHSRLKVCFAFKRSTFIYAMFLSRAKRDYRIYVLILWCLNFILLVEKRTWHAIDNDSIFVRHQIGRVVVWVQIKGH